MYLKRTAISLDEAKAFIAEAELKPRVITKRVREAHGFVIAEDMRATFPIPYFRRSGYDGYGILSEDDHDFPKSFEMVENVAAGDDFKKSLKPGQCIRIMTGAKVPDDVAKVIMLEVTKKTEDGRVLISESPAKSNISEIGEEIDKDELYLPKGTSLNAGAISVLVAFGVEEIQVYDKPKVAVVATGSELADSAGQNDGKIYNSNGPLLQGLAMENGAIATGEYVLPDQLDETRAMLDKLSRENDLVITTGGVSVGDFDYMAVIAQENDWKFNKLAMRPGSPTTFFIMNESPVVALSGNPSACFTGFWFFAEPLIRRFQGQKTAIKPGKAKVQMAYTKKNEFDRWLNGVLKDGQVSLNGQGQSSELSSLYQANCFFKIAHDSVAEVGQEVIVWQLPGR
ncbi:molybdopterin molybdotransferase MoeA [Lactococcus termiticola]|uniref:Molybdopterin molybdenumtransferase n=1 Tax=Lactococcus termiticola TaxID=2169526 RepID=A0A2R5HJD3_9LACT|nr:molybdopterin molybdotransferase MoeA [Lactococcus termiticola]GBG96331.1 molybdopterin biosynthesis protein MoeA [Lactococcus termiticola]